MLFLVVACCSACMRHDRALQEPALSTAMEALEAVVTGHSADHALSGTCVASMLTLLSSNTQTLENKTRAANVLSALLCKDARQVAAFRLLLYPVCYAPGPRLALVKLTVCRYRAGRRVVCTC